MGPSESKYSNPFITSYRAAKAADPGPAAPAPTEDIAPAPTPAAPEPETEPTQRMAGERWDTKKYGLDGLGMKDITGWRGEGKAESEIFGEIGAAIDAGEQVGKVAREKYTEYKEGDSNAWDTEKHGEAGLGMKDIEAWRSDGKPDSHIFGQVTRAKEEGRQVGKKAQEALDKYIAGNGVTKLNSEPTAYKYYVGDDIATDGSYRANLHAELGTFGENNGGHTFLNTGSKSGADFVFDKKDTNYEELFKKMFNYT